MIVDCHVHTYRWPEHRDREVVLRNLPSLARNWPEEKFISLYDAPIERYISENMEGDGIDKAILVGVQSPKTNGVHVPNKYLADLVAKYPDKLAWCCDVIPTEEGAAEEVERCVKEWGAIGVGELVTTTQCFYPNDERCYPVWEKAQELGVPIVIHCSPEQGHSLPMKYGDPVLLDDVAIAFPELKIVICHLGYYKYEDAVFLLEKHEHVYADLAWLSQISGLDRTRMSSKYPPVLVPYFHWYYPILLYLSGTWGLRDKLIWGSDWPWSSPRNGIELLTNINEYLRKDNLPEIPQEIIHNILHENWKKVFKINGVED